MQPSVATALRIPFLVVAVGLGGSIAAVWTIEGTGQEVKQPLKPPAAAQDDTEATTAAARAKILEGRLDDALTLIKEKAAKHPEWPPAHFILAQLLLDANQIPLARRALEQAAALAPDHPDIYRLFGMFAMADGRLSDARLNFENVIALAGSGHWDAERARIFRREGLKGLAAVSESQEDWKGAQNRLNAWLALEPKNGLARQRLGRVLFALGNAKEAFESLKQSVKDAPELEPAAVYMARLYGSKGDAKKAEEWFEYARKVEPANSQIRTAHAGWLRDQGQTADARKEVNEALRLDPNSREAQRVSAVIAWDIRDLAGAEKLLEPMHRDAPADSYVANLLALTLIEQADPAKQSRGLQLAEVNTTQFPRSTDAATTLGWALYRAGRIDEAEQKLRAAVQGVRVTADVAYFLSRILVDRGLKDQARNMLQLATKEPGAFAHRDDATALLKSLTAGQTVQPAAKSPSPAERP